MSRDNACVDLPIHGVAKHCETMLTLGIYTRPVRRSLWEGWGRSAEIVSSGRFVCSQTRGESVGPDRTIHVGDV
ncbi:hypothetical protein BO443_60041 [Burkholderia orbicola]